MYSKFKAKWEAMEQNSEFLRLIQYSAKQLKSMVDDKRVPYVLDFINNAINTYQGIQRDRRTEIYYYPAEKSDEVRTEVINVVKDAKLRENNFIYTESDVFLDGLVQKLGAVTYEWSREKNKNGTLKIRRIHPRGLMWGSSQEYDKSDATWMSYHDYFSRRELIMRHPDKKKIIDKLPSGLDEFDMDRDPSYLEDLLDEELQKLAYITYYERHWETRYFIQDSESGQYHSEYYDDQTSAEEEVAKMQGELQEAIIAETGQPAEVEGRFIVKKDKYPVVRKTVVVCEEELEHETIDEPFIPIDIYHPYFSDGDWYCPLDIQKDSQRYFNKMFSMADHWISAGAKGLILYDEKAVPKEEADKVQQAFSTTGGLIGVRDLNNYKEINSQGPSYQLFQLMETAKSVSEDAAGGRNFMGRKETASESGVAVRNRVEQAGLSSFVIFDNLRRWKVAVGEHVAWYLTHYLTYPEVVRIEGEELVQEVMQKFNKANGRDWFQKSDMRPGIGFFEINTDKQNTIEDLKVDVIVDEARWSVSKNQSILQEVNMAMQSNPNLAKTFPPEVMLEFLNLPFSEKEKARARIAQLEQMQTQLEIAKVQQQANISASLDDIMELPPMAAAQMLQKYFGVQVDPNQLSNPDQLERVKALAELQMKDQEHKIDMATKIQSAVIDGQIQKQKMGLEREKGIQQLELAKAKKATNGSKQGVD